MIKFYRKIRQKLIAEKKIGNYLLYAIGEIILVVIGILIALAINDNHEQGTIRKKEQVYLAGLRSEFETSRLKLQNLTEVNKTSLDGARKIMEFVSDENAVPDEKQFAELLYNTFAFDVSFNPNNSLLNEMINSGSLKDISNTELRKHLTNWLSTMEDIAKQEQELAMQREKVLAMFQSSDNSIRTILDLTGVYVQELGLPARKNHISNLNLLTSTEFENNVLMFMLAILSTEDAHYQPLMKDLNAILALIDAEIVK